MRAKRIQPIAKHAEQKQEDAARAFGLAQQALLHAETQLTQLTNYRDEYAQQLVAMSMNIKWLRDYQLFIVKINNAIEQAKVEIQNKQQRLEQRRLEWLKSRTRSKALNCVVEKYLHEEFVMQEKREQKETDEHGARIKTNKSEN